PCELLRRSASVGWFAALARVSWLVAAASGQLSICSNQNERLTWAKADPIYRHLYSSVPTAQAGPTLRAHVLKLVGQARRRGQARPRAMPNIPWPPRKQVHLYALGAAAWGGRGRRRRDDHHPGLRPLPGRADAIGDSGPPGTVVEATG